VDEGVPPEEITHQIQNRAKKEEATGSRLGVAVTKHEVKVEVKPKKLVNKHHLSPMSRKTIDRRPQEPIHDVGVALPVPTNRGSTPGFQLAPNPTNRRDADDDVILVDPVRLSPSKRKGESDQPSPQPTKRQSFWVEVPPRRGRVLSGSGNREPSSPEIAIKVEGATLTVKREPDQEASSALSVIRNVSLSFHPRTPWSVTSPVF